jgi:hypothetical protein
MLATFAHASARTSATAIASTRSVGRTGPKTTDMNGSTCAPRALFSGYACSSASVVAVISFCAEAIPAPGARRPRTRIGCVVRGIAAGSSFSGTQASTRVRASRSANPRP